MRKSISSLHNMTTTCVIYSHTLNATRRQTDRALAAAAKRNHHYEKLHFYFAPSRVRSIASGSVCLSRIISQKPHVQTSRNVPYMLPVAVARSSSDDNAICYVLPVSWMTSCFFSRWLKVIQVNDGSWIDHAALNSTPFEDACRSETAHSL